MSQRELVEKMTAEEVLDWMAYETSINPDFKERMHQEHLLTPEGEAQAIREMFANLGKKDNG